VLVGGTALANEMNDDAVRSDTQMMHINRYVYNTAGKYADEVAAERCGSGEAHVVTHHTMGDVAAAVFTAGFYTPEHFTMSCSRSAALP
jgi:hypothetical protein